MPAGLTVLGGLVAFVVMCWLQDLRFEARLLDLLQRCVRIRFAQPSNGSAPLLQIDRGTGHTRDPLEGIRDTPRAIAATHAPHGQFGLLPTFLERFLRHVGINNRDKAIIIYYSLESHRNECGPTTPFP